MKRLRSGVPHKSWGEEVAAAVTLKEGAIATEADILAFCKERLADFKRPKDLSFRDPAHGDRQDRTRRGCEGAGRRRVGMKFLIAGAGAIGGYIGAKLAQAGEDVTLFARGPHLKAMQEKGVWVIAAEGSDEAAFTANPKMTGDLSTATGMDVILLGVKAHGLTWTCRRSLR